MSINVASQLAVQAIYYNNAFRELKKELVGWVYDHSLIHLVQAKLDKTKQDMLNHYNLDQKYLITIKIDRMDNRSINLTTNMSDILTESNVEKNTADQIMGLLLGDGKLCQY